MAVDILLEIGTEELPAHAVRGLYRALREKTAARLEELGLSHGTIHAMGTPRRLALFVDDVAERQPDKTIERRGPAIATAFDADGNPTKAVLGFAKGAGTTPENLIKRDGYVYAEIHTVGKETNELLTTLFPELINTLPLPNTMRWRDLDFKFLRPIRWIVALCGTEVVPFEVAEVKSGRTSRGHRVLSNAEGEPFDPAGRQFDISEPKKYMEECEAMKVIACPVKRGHMIEAEIARVAAGCVDANGKPGQAQIEPALLEEVTFLVEWPTALAGRIDDKYMTLPREAIVTPMRDHQRYFPVVAEDGTLLPYFITVRSGGDRSIDVVSHGNERVLRARLADAEFFFKEDREKKLEDYVEKLKTLNFQKGLGTMYDKALRLEKLAAVVADAWEADEAEKTAACRAAKLAKADLVTAMVVEFTELEGTIGRSYALLDGEDSAVADAIDEHYRPRQAGGQLPDSTVGAIVSVADKIDTIVGTFSLGLIPTGSEDPFALRRQALGLVQTIVANSKRLKLNAIVKEAAKLYELDAEKTAAVEKAFADFIRLRLEKVLADNGTRYDIAAAAIDTDDCTATVLRANALSDAINRRPEEIEKLAEALGRAANLSAKAENAGIPDRDLYEVQEEENLHETYEAVSTGVAAALMNSSYNRAVEELAPLAPAIADYLDAVMVMAEDKAVRENRLALLSAITGLARRVADWGQLVL